MSVLDNSVVFLGACMHGGTITKLTGYRLRSSAAVTSGLKTDQHIVLEKRPLRDLYFTADERRLWAERERLRTESDGRAASQNQRIARLEFGSA